jgi:hypothetical protein
VSGFITAFYILIVIGAISLAYLVVRLLRRDYTWEKGKFLRRKPHDRRRRRARIKVERRKGPRREEDVMRDYVDDLVKKKIRLTR